MTTILRIIDDLELNNYTISVLPFLVACGTVYFFVFYYIRVWWRCGLCGKMNTTNFFKYLFQMCDHEGLL